MATKTDDASTGARARLAALVAHRWAALIGAWLVFLPVYGALRESLGGSARVLLIGAVIATGWYRGAWVGALTGLVIVPLSAVLHMVLTGGSLAVPDWMTADATAGTLGAILAGGVVGYVRERNLRLTADAAERQRSEDDLRARFARVTTAWRS